MAAGKYSFIIEQGATFQLNLTWTDLDGEPIPVEDYHARMQVRKSVNDPVALLNLSSSIDETGSGITLGPSGSIVIDISAESTENIDFTNGVYDLELVNGSYVVRVVEGKVRMSKNVTRDLT
jgi:hypothetical protein